MPSRVATKTRRSSAAKPPSTWSSRAIVQSVVMGNRLGDGRLGDPSGAGREGQGESESGGLSQCAGTIASRSRAKAADPGTRSARGRSYNRDFLGGRPPDAERHDSHPRLRVAVHPAHRPPAPRAPGLFRDPASRHQGRLAAGTTAEGHRALGRPRQRLRQGGAALRPRALRAGRARGRDLLRHAAHEPRPGRRGAALGEPGVRPGRVRGRRAGPLVAGHEPEEPGLDEPRRLDPEAAPGLRGRGLERHQHGRGHRGARPPPLRPALPPRGAAHRGRNARARELPRGLRVPARLERGLLRGGGRGAGCESRWARDA